MVSFDAEPSTYRHWKLDVEGELAYLRLDVAEDGGIVPGYELKMNSYDLGVDIELYDATSGCASSTPACARWSSPARRTATSARAPTSGCSPSRATRGR
jgi:hypothetical protein